MLRFCSDLVFVDSLASASCSCNKKEFIFVSGNIVSSMFVCKLKYLVNPCDTWGDVSPIAV